MLFGRGVDSALVIKTAQDMSQGDCGQEAYLAPPKGLAKKARKEMYGFAGASPV